VYFGDSGQDIETSNGDVPDSRLWIFEGHSEYKNGPLAARALFAFTSLSDSRELNEVLARPVDAPVADEMLGGYAEVGYDVYPLLFGDEARQLEPFIRVEYVDTQYDVPSGFEANRRNSYWVFTPGIQFKPHPNVALKLEYRNFDPRDGERPDELSFGMGFAF
jgi:hypothetical protein